jgi:hypothetical protein
MTGTNCDLFTHKSSRSYLNHLVSCVIVWSRMTSMQETVSDFTLKCPDKPKTQYHGITSRDNTNLYRTLTVQKLWKRREVLRNKSDKKK